MQTNLIFKHHDHFTVFTQSSIKNSGILYNKCFYIYFQYNCILMHYIYIYIYYRFIIRFPIGLDLLIYYYNVLLLLNCHKILKFIIIVSRTQKKQVLSKYYCTTCSKNYCDDCLERHDKNPVFKGHQVLDKSSDVAKDVFCRVHSHEQVSCRTSTQMSRILTLSPPIMTPYRHITNAYH